MLNAVSRRSEVFLDADAPVADRHADTLDTTRLASLLLEGIVAIEAAGAGARVRMRCETSPLSFHFDTEPSDRAASPSCHVTP